MDEFNLLQPTNADQIAALTAYIKNHLSDTLTLPVLARRMHVSPGYLDVLFQRYIGASAMEYVQAQRLKHAQQLLVETDRSVSDISRIVGFSTVTYFDAVFKKHFRISPLQWRKHYWRAAAHGSNHIRFNPQ